MIYPITGVSDIVEDGIGTEGAAAASPVEALPSAVPRLDVEGGIDVARAVSALDGASVAYSNSPAQIAKLHQRKPTGPSNCDIPVGTAIGTVLNSIDFVSASAAAELHRELVVMLPPILPVPMAELSPGEDAGFLVQDVPAGMPNTTLQSSQTQQNETESSQKAKPLNVDAASWFPRHLDGFEINAGITRTLPSSFSNVVPSPEYTFNDYEVGKSDEA